MQLKIRTTALVALFAFSSSIALAQSTVMSKETGPAASADFTNYWSDSVISHGFRTVHISFLPSGTGQNSVMNLRYYDSWMMCFVSDGYCSQGQDVFEGPIPAASVTYS